MYFIPKCTIVINDGNIIELQFLGCNLTAFFDINLITSSSSNDVLTCLKYNAVDFIIQNVIHSELDGWNFLRLIRSQERLKDIFPVLFITDMSLDDAFREKQ